MTALEIALALRDERGLKSPEDQISEAELAEVEIPLFGGCVRCGASIAAYNAFPQKSGYWACEECSTHPIDTLTEWHTVCADLDAVAT